MTLKSKKINYITNFIYRHIKEIIKKQFLIYTLTIFIFF